MNFYDFHIGDYASRTAHLEPMEDLAYRRMLDLYYVREEPLPASVADIARLIRLRGQEVVIQAVLDEFFVQGERGCWTHDRCEAVIAKAGEKRGKAKASADERWARERAAKELEAAMQAQCERSPNALPPQSEGNTPSPSPSPTTQKKRGAAAPTPEGVSDSLWADFLKTRKARMTDTALRGIQREAGKAGMTLTQTLELCCERGWRGFKADWLANSKPADVRTITVPGSPERDPALQKLDADAANAAPLTPERRAALADARRGKVH